jgi:hypothetical protein
MPKKKIELVTVKMTYPIRYQDRLLEPGETATVPAEIAAEWIEKMQAVNVAAEVAKDGE